MNKNKQYYEQRKLNFVNSSLFNAKRHGYTLTEPYTIQEIQDYENKYNVKIPNEYKNYLLNIPKEFVGSYPYIINLLQEPLTLYFYKDNDAASFMDCCLFKHWNDECEDNCDETLVSEKYTPEQITEKGFNINYFLQVEQNGCTENVFVCVKGNFFGKRGFSCAGGDYFQVE